MRPVWWMMTVVLLAGCASQPPVDVFVIRLTPLESTGLEQRLRIDLRVQNPTDQPISVRGIQLGLDVNGRPLARGVSNEAFTVPSLGEATTSIVTSTSLFDLLRQVIGLESRQALDYSLKGHLYRDGGWPGSLRFERAGTLVDFTERPANPPAR